MTIASRFLALTVVLFATAFAFQALAQGSEGRRVPKKIPHPTVMT